MKKSSSIFKCDCDELFDSNTKLLEHKKWLCVYDADINKMPIGLEKVS